MMINNRRCDVANCHPEPALSWRGIQLIESFYNSIIALRAIKCVSLLLDCFAALAMTGYVKTICFICDDAKNIKIIKNKLLSYLFILFTFLPTSAKASSFNDILSSLSAISCETLYLVEQSYYPNTCIPSPLFNTLIANILSPGIYVMAMGRLKINNDKLFPGNCTREKRANPHNPKISFGFCSNLLLVPLRAAALSNVVVGLLVDSFTGKDPWANIAKSWHIDPEKYHNMYRDKSVGTSGVFVDINLSPMIPSPVVVFPWEVVKRNDTICVATIAFTGWLPVGCKYMVDPYLVSRYYNFFHSMPPNLQSESSEYEAVTLQDETNNPGLALTSASESAGLVSCLQNSCHINTMLNTKTLIPMSGPIVSCVQQMLTKVLISQDVCSFDQYSAIISNPSARARSTIYAFQDSMRTAVTGLLTLYIIFVGLKILLGGEIPQKGELVRYLVKLVLVIYFSIGITLRSGGAAFDGMSQWILPIVFGGAAQLAGWITNISPSELCVFSPSEYQSGYGYLALWDALDCRVANYLGIDQVADMLSRNAQNELDFDALRTSIPPWIFLLVPAIYSGQLSLVMLALLYPILIISVSAYMVYAFVVCLISITILSVLAPVFVPMALFEYTKGYFESWVKLIISFVLQPMVVSTFMITVFTVYDFGFFGTCKFKALKITQAVEGTNTTRKLYALNNNMNDLDAYPNSAAVNGCVNTLGWIFNAPFGLISGSMSGESIKTIISDQAGSTSIIGDQEKSLLSADDGTEFGTVSPKDPTFDKYLKYYPILSSLKPEKGIFFSSMKLVGSLKSLIFSLFTACLCLYLLKELSEQVAEFAADMTEGLVISPPRMPPPIPPKNDQGGAGEAKDTAAQGEGGGEAADTARRDGGSGAIDSIMSHGSGENKDRISGGGAKDDAGENKDRISGGKAAPSNLKGAMTEDQAAKKIQDAFRKKQELKLSDIKIDIEGGGNKT